MNVSGAGTSNISSGGGGKRKKNDGDMIDLVELVGNSPSNRNWRGIVIALLVIVVVCALIVGAVILVTPKNDRASMGDSFTFNDMFDPEYKPRLFQAQWVGDRDEFVYKNREGELIVYTVEVNQLENTSTTTLMDNSTFLHLNCDMYYISQDLNYILLAYDVEPVFRHTFKARYNIYSRLSSIDKSPLLDFPNNNNGQWTGVKIQFAGFSPKGNSLSFVYENNLYYQANPDAQPVQVTNTGKQGLVYNGVPDWVYEEEILGSTIAHWWSPESGFICFAQFNDTNVPKYQFPKYGAGDLYYGEMESIPYPKAGQPGEINPTVTLYIIATDNPTGVKKTLKPPVEFRKKEHYFTNVAWKDEHHVLVTWTNRPQNKSIITLCGVQDGECVETLTESNHNGWVTLTRPWLLDDQHYAILLSQRGHKGHWKHIAKVTMSNAGPLRLFLTQGEFDVTEIVAVDRANKFLYYISTGGDPRKRHLYRVRTDTDMVSSHQECLTCDYAEDCQFVKASFSASGNFYILGCHGPEVPYFVLKSTLDDRDIVLEANLELRNKLQKKYMPVKDYLEIDTPSGDKIWAELYLPRIMFLPEKTKDGKLQLKKDQIIQYPLLVHTYGGPGSQKVTMEYQLGWMAYLVSSEDVIYASIDGRGSGGRGDDFMHQVYQRLGTVEVDDQIVAIKHLKKNLRYVDNNRTAIWGWSYGGFVSSHVLADKDNSVSCGIAVAPVSDWRYYDTVYTERYMKYADSSDNYKGYDTANVSAKAANFKNKEFMIVHGTADDNVHYQHSAHLIKALTEAEVEFRTQIYTDKNHAISGPNTSRHLYKTMTSFLQEDCWFGGKPRDVKTEDLQHDKAEELREQ